MGLKIQRQPWNRVSVMISVSRGTQFSSMIYEAAVVELGSGDDFWVWRDVVFIIDF